MELIESIAKPLIGWLLILFLSTQAVLGQGQTMIQIKGLDHHLKPYPGLELSINNSKNTRLDHQGKAFLELAGDNLPPELVTVVDRRLEVESWNFSQGILEVVVRERTHRLTEIRLQDQLGKPIPGVEVIYKSEEPIKATSDQQGLVKLNLPIDENLSKTGLLSVKNFRIMEQTFKGDKGYLKLRKLPKIATSRNIAGLDNDRGQTTPESIDEFQQFNFEYLDSIQSLTVFYAVIKNINLENYDQSLKQRIDDKFFQLMDQWSDSLNTISKQQFSGNITDSTLIEGDVSLLIEQAIKEQRTLDRIKNDFDSNVATLEEKLRGGGADLTEEEQLEIYQGINLLAEILNENEQKFLKNRAQFNSLLNLLSSRLTSIGELEAKLFLSEQQLEQQSEEFRKKIFTAVGIALALGLFGLISVILTRKFQRQKNQLAIANKEVKRVNEHLEELVAKRTRQLQETNSELDTFLYKSSHNLRRPLTSIVGLSNLARITLDEKGLELFERAAETARNMDRMLKKLINVNEINNPSDFGTVDFSEQIQQILAQSTDWITDRKIDIKYTVQEDLDFSSYPELTSIILQNLIENALFYSSVESNGHRPLVRLDITRHNGYVVINLKNNGPDIDPTVKEQIWNMFYVGHEKSEGNGLGLYIARKAVKTLKGSLSCQIDDAGHTNFHVELPVGS